MNLTPERLIITAFFLWLFILTVLFFRFYLYYIRLLRKGKKESIAQVLDDLFKKDHEHEKAVDNLYKRYDILEKDGAFHIQKIGLSRFNPFKDTGGDQSFILALLDGDNSGVVVSSLHTRTGTRWYAKRVLRGKGVEYELSDEEEKTIKGAKILS